MIRDSSPVTRDPFLRDTGHRSRNTETRRGHGGKVEIEEGGKQKKTAF